MESVRQTQVSFRMSSFLCEGLYPPAVPTRQAGWLYGREKAEPLARRRSMVEHAREPEVDSVSPRSRPVSKLSKCDSQPRLSRNSDRSTLSEPGDSARTNAFWMIY